MMNGNVQIYENYKKVNVQSSTPGKLLIMLFEGAIKNIDNAKKAIELKDINTAHNLIIKTQNIVIELIASLKVEYEISNNLFYLYEYIYYQLVQANVSKDIGKLDEIREFLVVFCDTWNEAIKKSGTIIREKAGNNIQQYLDIQG
ncbi:MAG: flagellar export chaperone FliS [Syntrophomonadaceae bacterium]